MDKKKLPIGIDDFAEIVRKEFKESFYHGMLLGILISAVGWSVDSYCGTIHRMVPLHAKANRESGEGGGLAPMVPDSRGSRQMEMPASPFGSLQRGYYDIAIEIEDESIGIIIEVKYAENENFDAACKEAMDQIDKNNYTAMLKEDDMQTILKYGIACCKKKCRVVMQEEVWEG